MSTLLPYSNLGRSLSTWPFDLMNNLGAWPEAEVSSSFKMNVVDNGDVYEIEAILPGVKKEDIDVELNEGRLSISAKRVESDEAKAKNYLVKETGEWKAYRGVYLKDAAGEGLSAQYNDGVLKINVPKQQQKNNVFKVNID